MRRPYFVWDYDIKETWQPHTDKEWGWFLVRKINYSDFRGLKKEIVARYFPKIEKLLDPGKREMLRHFLHQ